MKNNFEEDAEKGSPNLGGSAQSGKVSANAKSPKAAQRDAVDQICEEIAIEADAIDELTEALAEANELRDRHLRLKAEWDNYRKRTENERADERSRATQYLVEKLLPVVDDLERALEHCDATKDESFKDGIVQVVNKIQGVLASEGVKVIDPKGEPFDAHLHSAVSKVEDNKFPDETVLEVYQKGYEMGNRVLRPAVVVVSHT